MNSLPVYVIDTSYLLELFAVPGCSTEDAVVKVRNRVADAARNGARLYVTVPSVYELAKHISDVRDGDRRSSLASQVRDAVLSSINGGAPWSVVPSKQLEVFKDLIVSFADNHVRQGIDLSDGTLIDEARRLKRERYRGPDWRVHIWTKDRNLKAREPDNEPNAYLG